MDEGDLVPDDVMIGIVDERLQHADARRRGYVLDGFPRTAAQAQALDEMIKERPLDVVVDLEVPREVVLQRLAGRRVCLDCGANYSVAVPPKQSWTCDFCGGEVIQRDDDTEEAIARRLDLYDLPDRPPRGLLQEPGHLRRGRRSRVGRRRAPTHRVGDRRRA